ncbi:helix-turn-helix transcriptional regulator [Terasakiella sp. SH-1]|uniref:helix-turn-helix transcriptional regulator n=1 Tax=Terasakiella sp. SH-1 TaxID=2560057 RepID=UPI0010738B50|nr:helix-turn-helix transcriptional regulator [Terasakiella sp. SH-1]
MQTTEKNRFEVQSLVISFVIIAICEVFFLADVIADFFSIDIDTTWFDHDTLERFSVLALSCALIVIGRQVYRLFKEHQQATDTVDVASGELLNVIERHFTQWGLSPSEREVALLLIKGLSTQEIADLRETKIGTVKSQTSSIYQKASLKGRNELVAYFVEDLLAGESLTDTKPQPENS